MQTLQEYKCPCCGGAIAFDSTLQKMKCPFCDTEFDMETLAGYDSVLKNEASDDMSWESTAGKKHCWDAGRSAANRASAGTCCSCWQRNFSIRRTALPWT